MKEPVIIIRYFTWLKLFPKERELTYELCKQDRRAEDGWKVISTLEHLEAMELIEENEMEMVVRNKYGTIWKGEMDLKSRRRKPSVSHLEDISEEIGEDAMNEAIILELCNEQ